MNRYAGYIMVCILVALLGPHLASAQKIKVDYDRGVDFSKFKTYTWAELDPARLPLLRLNIIGAIDGQLTAKGLLKVEKDGDLMVAYSGDMVGEQNQGVGTPNYPGYAGQPPAIDATMWTGQAGPGASGMSVTYPKGSLIIELMDPRASKITWRAVGGLKLDIEKKSDSLARINSMIASMFDQYPPRKK
jgi:hypothetical protein